MPSRCICVDRHVPGLECLAVLQLFQVAEGSVPVGEHLIGNAGRDSSARYGQ